ncbi:hypothetical protein [Bremerella sp. P1]|uniref:hypothetical protein n=1 Tax=Bremerella sp. P1 TaxID=3026424 RepID=UPI0023677434|nr:hypothetical protein [Bremerella sp. P1]WDI40861.1 hypothetical protein PSR63_20545 [Bremerella sp. P1]
MSSSSHAQPDPSGSFSRENAPQVVVRAGKTYVCSACGTLVEIPVDVVGQLVMAVEPSSPDEKEETEPEEQVPAQTSKTLVEVAAPRLPPKKVRPQRPNRPQQPARETLVGELIDGLRVPSAKELDRALAWVSFHLKVLDRQGSEIRRLKKLLKNQSSERVPGPCLPGRAKEITREEPVGRACGARHRHAPADLGVAPMVDNANERGPP